MMVCENKYLQMIINQTKTKKYTSRRFNWGGCWCIVKAKGSRWYETAVFMADSCLRDEDVTISDIRAGYSLEKGWTNIYLIRELVTFGRVNFCGRANRTPFRLLGEARQSAESAIIGALGTRQHKKNNF